MIYGIKHYMFWARKLIPDLVLQVSTFLTSYVYKVVLIAPQEFLNFHCTFRDGISVQ